MDEVDEFLKFYCKNCAKARKEDKKFVCQDDGQEKKGTDTCPYWRERHDISLKDEGK